MTGILDRRAAAPAAAHRAAVPHGYRVAAPTTLLLLAVAAFLLALPSLGGAPKHPFGLLFAGSPLYPIALALVAGAFCLAIALGTTRIAGVALLASVLVMRLPTVLAVEAPLYSWTYKHFGVTDYIDRNGELARGVDIYHSWPGMFAASSWVSDVTGVSTSDIALWFAVATQLLLAGAVYLLCRSQGLSAPAALTGGFIAQTFNWVGQDYYSPQAVGFTLGVVVLALMLASPRSRAAAWIGLALFAAIVVAHQLTPYWLILCVGALTVLGRIRPRYIVIVMAVIAVAFMALNLDVLSRFGSLLNFDIAANAQTVDRGASSAGQQFSSWGSRSITLLLWGGTAAVLLRRFLRDRRAWRDHVALGVIAFSSVAILGGQSYGGEAIFRVFLYSLPGCALVLAPVVVSALTGAATHLTRLARAGAIAALIISTLASAQAYYGGWFANLVTTRSIEVTTGILRDETSDTMTIGVAPGAPGRLNAEYVRFAQSDRNFDVGVDSWINTWPDWEGYDFRDPQRVSDLTANLVGQQQPTIVIITEQMLDYSAYYGIFRDGSLEAFTEILRTDPRWTVEIDSPEIFKARLELGR